MVGRRCVVYGCRPATAGHNVPTSSLGGEVDPRYCGILGRQRGGGCDSTCSGRSGDISGHVEGRSPEEAAEWAEVDVDDEEEDLAEIRDYKGRHRFVPLAFEVFGAWGDSTVL